jgi:hypothetical protein
VSDDTYVVSGQDRPVSIDFFNLLDDEGWVPLSVDEASVASFRADGRPLSDAPVDIGAMFDGAMWRSTKIDRAFNLCGLRCRPNFTVPRHHHNLRQLIIVCGGELFVEHGDRGGEETSPLDRRRVGAGQFFVSDAGTPFTTTAGPEGAIYIATWPAPVATLETYWHEDGWISR